MSRTTYAPVTLFDITLMGSIIGQGESLQEAKENARRLSLTFPNRLVRVHDLDGETVLVEVRNGVTVFETEGGSRYGWAL